MNTCVFVNVNINDAKIKYLQIPFVHCCVTEICHLLLLCQKRYITENGKLTLKNTLYYVHNVVKSKQNVDTVT